LAFVPFVMRIRSGPTRSCETPPFTASFSYSFHRLPALDETALPANAPGGRLLGIGRLIATADSGRGRATRRHHHRAQVSDHDGESPAQRPPHMRLLPVQPHLTPPLPSHDGIASTIRNGRSDMVGVTAEGPPQQGVVRAVAEGPATAGLFIPPSHDSTVPAGAAAPSQQPGLTRRDGE
jgi:hypothetical protein